MSKNRNNQPFCASSKNFHAYIVGLNKLGGAEDNKLPAVITIDKDNTAYHICISMNNGDNLYPRNHICEIASQLHTEVMADSLDKPVIFYLHEHNEDGEREEFYSVHMERNWATGIYKNPEFERIENIPEDLGINSTDIGDDYKIKLSSPKYITPISTKEFTHNQEHESNVEVTGKPYDI